MPAPRFGGQPYSPGHGGFSSGGGPDAGFLSQPIRAPSTGGTNVNPYANVGKFNLNVMSPSAFVESNQQNAENTSIIHGLSEGVFGSNGGVLGGVPVVSTIGQTIGNVVDWQAGILGNVIGGIGSVPNPFGAAFTFANYLASPETSEKAEVQRRVDAHGFNLLAGLREMAEYTASLDAKHYEEHPEDTGPLGLYAINPELSKLGVNPLGGFDIGGMAEGAFAGLFTPARLISRAIAGFGGANGNMLESLQKEDPTQLGEVQREAVARFRSGEWSNDRATDYLVRNNAGLSANPFVNIIFEAALDPMVWGSFGAGALAKGGKAFGRMQQAMEAIEAAEAVGATTREEAIAKGVRMTVEEARTAKLTLGMDKEGIAQEVTAIEEKMARGSLTRSEGAQKIEDLYAGRGFGPLEGFLERTIGRHAWPVINSPTMGPVARRVHNLIDPTRLLFSEKDPAMRVLKVRLSTETTAAGTHAFGLFNVDNLYGALEKFHPELIPKVMDAFGGYMAGITRVWAGHDIASTMLKRAEQTFGDISMAIDTRLADLPHDFFTQIEHMTRDVTPLSTTVDEIAKRMATAFGGEVEDYLAFVKTLNHDQRAYLHAATTHVAREELLDAVAKAAANGTWTLPYDIRTLILIGPGELTKQRADALVKQLNKLKGPDRIAAAKAAVQQYDVLRSSHSISGDVSVQKVIDHIKGLDKADALASEMQAKDIANLTGELEDWLNRFGASADGEVMYGLGFRPKDENLWRLIHDKNSDAVLGVSPWVDYVAEKAPGYRPGFGRTLPGFAQQPMDWLAIANSNLWHSVSTQRVALEAERRFIQLSMERLGMTEVEGRRVHALLGEEARQGEATMRGVSGQRMWEKALEGIPDRLKGETGITRRELVDTVLQAYKSEMHIVGATQMLTGQMKAVLDKIPLMNMAGGNYLGQISERLWPNLKFKFNPFFQYQESGEGQFFSILKGIRPYWKGAINQRDERAFRVWNNFDPNLEGVGDQLENSVSALQGHIAGTLKDSSGIKRIKYVNASRQFRNHIGQWGREHYPPELMAQLRAKYGTMNDGEVMVRYLDEQLMENRRVIEALEMGTDGAFDNIIKAAAWSKLPTLGAIGRLHMDEVARTMGVKTHGDLIRAVKSSSNQLTTSDVAERLLGMGANPDYVKRVVVNLDYPSLDKWWKRAQKEFGMTDAETMYLRNIERAYAAARGMNLSEWMSQRVAGQIKRFDDPAKLPTTDTHYMAAARQGNRDRNLVVYAHDDPEVLAMQDMARAQYDLSLPAPERQAGLQKAHDRVQANPEAYAPGPTTTHAHVANGRSHVTGSVGFEQFMAQVETWVGGGRDPLTGELMNASAIMDATRWYRELPALILGLMRGDKEKAAKVYLAWTYSQKSDSPMQGFKRTLMAYDRHQFATSRNMTDFMRDDLGLAREQIAAVMKGEPVTSGLGIKLWDFSGAALGMNKRVVGHLMPSPADRWAFRGAGFMDAQGLGQFMRAYGYRTAEEAGYFDSAPYVRPKMTKETDPVTGERIQAVDKDGELLWEGDYHKYIKALNTRNKWRVSRGMAPLKRVYTSIGANEYEYVTKWLNDMTTAANAAHGGTGWMGKNDWQPRDLQALDWVRIQNAFGAYPESGADMGRVARSQLVIGIDPMKRGPWGTHIEDFNLFGEQDELDYLGEMGVQTAAVIEDILGIPVTEVHTGRLGVYENPGEGPGHSRPMMNLIGTGTGETSDRMALTSIALHQADFAVVIREVPLKSATAQRTNRLTGEVEDTGYRYAIDFELGDKPRLVGQPTAAGYGSSGREVGAEELAEIREYGQQLYNQMGKTRAPLTHVENPELFDRTVTNHQPEGTWGGASYDPRTGEFLGPEPWMYHGAVASTEASVRQGGIHTGTFTADPADPFLLTGEGTVMYRTRVGLVTRPSEKGFEKWKHPQGTIAPENVQISRDGGQNWEPMVPETVTTRQGPWTSAVGETKSYPAADLQTREAFDKAYSEFVVERADDLAKSDHNVGTFWDEGLGRIEFDVVVVTRTAEDTEAIQTAMGRAGGAYNLETEMGLFAARNGNETVRLLAELPSIRGTRLLPYALEDGTIGLRWVWDRMTKQRTVKETGEVIPSRIANTTPGQVNAKIGELEKELNAAGLGWLRMNARTVHVKEYTHDWATDPKAHAISDQLGRLGPAGDGADRALFGDSRFRATRRGQTEGEHAGTNPNLVGDFRERRDSYIAHLLRNPVRGRATPDGLYVGDTGAVNAGVHGYTVAPPLPLTPEMNAELDVILKTQGMTAYKAARDRMQGHGGATPTTLDRMRRRIPGAYLEHPLMKAGHVGLMPRDALQSISKRRLEYLNPAFGEPNPEMVAIREGFRTKGVDEPLVLEWAPVVDEVRFADPDMAWRYINAADHLDWNYLPVTIKVHPDPAFPAGHPTPTTRAYSTVWDHTPTPEEIAVLGENVSPTTLGFRTDLGFDESYYNPSWSRTHEMSRGLTAEAAKQTKIPGFPLRGPGAAGDASTGLHPWHYPESAKNVERMLAGIYDSPGGSIPLYSGQRVGDARGFRGAGRYENPEVGDVIKIPLKGTTEDRSLAHAMMDEGSEPGFMFVFPEGTRGIVDEKPAFEIIVSGEFRVARLEKVDTIGWLREGGVAEHNLPRVTGLGIQHPKTEMTLVHLEPQRIFNPTSKQWESYHRTMPTEPDTSGMTLFHGNDEVVRGATSVMKDGRALLWAGKSADALTFAHEMAHVMHLHLDPSMRARVLGAFNKETKRRLTRWNRDVSEWFADSYIRMLREGSTVEDPELQRAYNFFAKWVDKRVKAGPGIAERKGMQAKGAMSEEEAATLSQTMKPQTRALFEEMAGGPKTGGTAYNATEEAIWTAMTDAAKEAGYDAFRVNFFKRNRTLLERSVNHPIFGLYPASYMWGKVLPEMVRFIAKDPFGFPGGHVAWASHDVWRSIQQQSELDPEFKAAMDGIGKNEFMRIIALTLPATPWEHAVNAPAWTRRIAQAGLENEARAKAGLAPKPINLADIWKDTMQYQFGAIPNTFDAIARGTSGLEDIYAIARGEKPEGKNAPSLGQGMQTVTHTLQELTAPLGDNLPSVTDIFGQTAGSDAEFEQLTQQSDELEAELAEAQSQLEAIFERYPFTQQ